MAAQYTILTFTPCGLNGAYFTTNFDQAFYDEVIAGGGVIAFSAPLQQTCFTVGVSTVAVLPPSYTIVDWNVQGYGITSSCSVCRADLSSGVKLVDCSNPANTLCVTNNIVIGSIVTIVGFPNTCWIAEAPEECTEIYFVNIVQTFNSCPNCQDTLPVTNYQLTDCNNPDLVVYTSTDLADYVGQIVTLDEYADQCFYVTVLDTDIPSDISVTVINSFVDCTECQAQPYLLIDCAGILEDIVTYTDLSANVGEVIVISTCPDTCWSVEETDIVDFDGSVQVINQYETCSTCLANTTSEEENFDVVTYEGVVTKYTVGANSTLPKSCLISWTVPVGIVVTEYGDCTNGVCPTPAPQPKRKVTPGYNTPACTPAYYENVECNFSEWMYKDVLERRYGISSCCVEELMKWEIKHEMLMLDALINPDYVCQPTSSCCNPPTPVGCTSCGCSSCNCNN
jgi:hypothetical protein